MKKFLKIGIALMLAILTCTFILASCGKKDDDKNTVKGEEVSRSEWVKALKFSGVKSFSFSLEETGEHSKYGSSILEATGTYDKGTLEYDYSSSYNDGKNKESGSDTEELDNMMQLWWLTDAADDFFDLIEDDAYLGYSEFEYNSKTGAYEAVFDNSKHNSWYSYEETFYVSIKIVDGHLVSLVVTLEGRDWGTASGDDYDYTYTNKTTITFKDVK